MLFTMILRAILHTEDVRTRRGVCVRKATKDDDICLSSFLLVYLVCTGSPRIRWFSSFVCLNRALGSLVDFMDGFHH